MRYITATIFSVTYRFCNHTRQKNLYVSIYEAGRTSNVLEKTEKRAKDGVLLTVLYEKKIRPSKNTLVATTILKNPEVT